MSKVSVSDQQIVTTLRRARKQLARYQGWTYGCLARNWQGKRVNTLSPDAYSFCLVGAVHRHAEGMGIPQRPVNRELRRTLGLSRLVPLSLYNDKAGYANVIRLIDKTIERLTPKETPVEAPPEAPFTTPGEIHEEERELVSVG